MFPSKLPLLYVLQILLVAACVAAVVYVTKNPLGILGLFFMPNVQLVPDYTQAPHHTDATGNIGFTAEVQ